MTQQIDSRPKSLSYLMIVPAIFALGLMAAFGFVMYKMSQEGVANGPRVEIQLQGSCLKEAQPIIQQRMEMIGLGEPTTTIADGVLIATTKLPGRREDEKETIPTFLSAQGRWKMQDNGKVLLQKKDIRAVTYGEDESGMIEVLLAFHSEKKKEVQQYLSAHKDGASEIWLDDRMVIKRPNTIELADDFRFVSEITDPTTRFQEAADFYNLLSSPTIPCMISVQGVKEMKE